MKIAILRLWLVLCASLGVVLLSGLFGFLQEVWQRHQPYLAAVIVLLYFGHSAELLFLARKVTTQSNLRDLLDPFRYTASLFFGLGIVGTAWGLYTGLNTFFGADPAAYQNKLPEAIASIAGGCLVNVTGVVCFYALSYQLMQVKKAHSRMRTEHSAVPGVADACRI